VILFSDEPEADIARIEAALDDGRITAARLDEAMIRILGLKAALTLHKTGYQPADRSKLFNPDNARTAEAVTARAPTLVKDVQGHPAPVARPPPPGAGLYDRDHHAPAWRGRADGLPRPSAREGFEVTLYPPKPAPIRAASTWCCS
jgi:beta-N-acetylhexosaminidase